MKPMMLYLSGGWLGKQVTVFPLLSTCVAQSFTGKIRSVPDPLLESPLQFDDERPLTRQTYVGSG